MTKLQWAVVGTSEKHKLVVGLCAKQDQAQVWAVNLYCLTTDSKAGWLRFDVYNTSQLDGLKLGPL